MRFQAPHDADGEGAIVPIYIEFDKSGRKRRRFENGSDKRFIRNKTGDGGNRGDMVRFGLRSISHPLSGKP